MPVERLYIYRSGTTNACALTAEKGEPRLPAPLAPDRWQFWMQTSRHQTDDALYGFALETAMTQIANRGYYLFTGSTRLLETRGVAQSAIPQLSIMSAVRSLRSYGSRHFRGPSNRRPRRACSAPYVSDRDARGSLAWCEDRRGCWRGSINAAALPGDTRAR